MPRWKGQKWIHNDTEQTEQTNKLIILGCKLQTAGQGQVTTANATEEWHPQLETPTLIPPIHLPLRGPQFEPKDCRCEKICHWNHASGSHDAQLTPQWRSTTSTGYNHGNGREFVVWAICTCKIWGAPGAIWIKQVDLRMWWWVVLWQHKAGGESVPWSHSAQQSFRATTRARTLKRTGETIFSVPDLN